MSTWFFYNWNFQQVPVYENIMNAVCNPFFNNYLCDYDGGDCCTPFVDLDACGLASNCMCHFTGKTHATFEQVRFYIALKFGHQVADYTFQFLVQFRSTSNPKCVLLKFLDFLSCFGPF